MRKFSRWLCYTIFEYALSNSRLPILGLISVRSLDRLFAARLLANDHWMLKATIALDSHWLNADVLLVHLRHLRVFHVASSTIDDAWLWDSAIITLQL